MVILSHVQCYLKTFAKNYDKKLESTLPCFMHTLMYREHGICGGIVSIKLTNETANWD